MCVCVCVLKLTLLPILVLEKPFFPDNLYRRMKSRRESHPSYHCVVFFTSSGKQKQGSEGKGVHSGMVSPLKPGQESATFTGQF